MKYWYRILSIIFFVLNRTRFKSLAYSAKVRPSVRVQGYRYIRIGQDAVVQRLSWLLAVKIDQHDPELVIGEGCAIGDFAHITCVRKVVLERNVLLANNVYISDNQHGFSDITRPVMKQPVVFTNEVVLGEGCWIGENACIMASVGRNSVVAANAVVTRPVPDFCVAGGIPARLIKKFNATTGIWEKIIAE